MLRDIVKAVRAESKDRNTRSATKQAAGAAMVADGLFGLENPLDGKEKRVGIGGALFMALFGLVFMVGGYLVGQSMFQADDGDVVVTGVIVDVTESTRRRDGRTSTTYSPVVSYADPATGESYEVSTGWSSSSRPTIGDDVEVAFPPDNPAAGKILSRTGSWITWGVVALGAIIFLVGIGKFLVRLVTIGFGVKLFLDGRRERQVAGDDRPVVEALVDGAQDVVDDITQARRSRPGAGTHSTVDAMGTILDKVAEGMRGELPTPTTVPESGTTPPPSPVTPPPGAPARTAPPQPAPPPTRVTEPTTPPPGWYADPGGSGHRWWDGAAWTNHVHPPPSAGPTA